MDSLQAQINRANARLGDIASKPLSGNGLYSRSTATSDLGASQGFLDIALRALNPDPLPSGEKVAPDTAKAKENFNLARAELRKANLAIITAEKWENEGGDGSAGGGGDGDGGDGDGDN